MGQVTLTRAANGSTAEIDRAIEVFVRAFCFSRSFTHPYLPKRFGPVWVMSDAPRTSGDWRTAEWVVHGVPPERVDRLARHTTGRFALCIIVGSNESDAPTRTGYKALGYRLRATEPMMIHRLARVPRFDSSVPIERVTTQDAADELAKAARSRQILPEHLADGSKVLRQYVARESTGGRPIGWVRSVVVGNATWCCNMYVAPAFRRRGIGRAMLTRMLRDDRANGSTLAVLMASHTGALLYPVLGYEQIGMLYLFSPRKP